MAGRQGRGRADKEYRPKRKAPVVSEEEEDDFEDVTMDAATTSSVSDLYIPWLHSSDVVRVLGSKKEKDARCRWRCGFSSCSHKKSPLLLYLHS